MAMVLGCFNCLKYLLLIVNFFFWVSLKRPSKFRTKKITYSTRRLSLLSVHYIPSLYICPSTLPALLLYQFFHPPSDLLLSICSSTFRLVSTFYRGSLILMNEFLPALWPHHLCPGHPSVQRLCRTERSCPRPEPRVHRRGRAHPRPRVSRVLRCSSWIAVHPCHREWLEPMLLRKNLQS